MPKKEPPEVASDFTIALQGLVGDLKDDSESLQEFKITNVTEVAAFGFFVHYTYEEDEDGKPITRVMQVVVRDAGYT